MYNIEYVSVCPALQGVLRTAESLTKLNEIEKFNGIATKTSQIEKMSLAVKGLTKENTLLLLTNKNVNLEDQKSILIKAGIITKEEAETLAVTADTVAKGANLGITELLTVAWAKLNAVIRENPFTAFLVVVTTLGVAMGKIADRALNAEKYTKKTLDESVEKVNDIKSEIDSLNSELQTTQNRIDNLNAKENLSLVEQEELERLRETNKGLERELRLKESILSEEQKDAIKDAKKYFTTKKDSLKFESSYEGVEIHEKTDYIGTVEERIEKLQQYTDGQIALSKETIETYKDYVESALSDFMEEDDYLIEGQDDGLLKRLDTLYEKYDIYTNGKAYVTENKLKDILAKADFQSASKQLEELGKSGELSLTTLSSRFPDLIEYLDQAGISAEELYQYIMALSNPDAVNYAEIEKQFMSSLGLGNRVDNAGEVQIWNEVRDLGEHEAILDAYIKIRDQYGDHPEGWNVKDWITHIQSELESEVVEVDTLLSISDTITHLNTNLKPAFDSLHAAYQNIFTDDGTLDRSSIDILSTCDSIKSKLDEMSELGLKVDYSSYEDFVRVLNNTETTEQDMQTAFDSLATSITDAALSGAEDFETMRAALEDLGVVNNEMVAFDALIRNTEALKEAGLDLSEATYDDIEAFVKGIGITEDYGQAVNLLKIQKILCAENPLDTSGDIMNLYLLANAAGIATDSILQLMRLNADYTKASAEGNTAASLVALGQMEVVKQKIQNQFAHLGDNVDFATIGGGTSAAGNAGRSAGRSYRDALKEELSELDSIISGVTRSIDEQINSVNEQKSSALEALDAEKNALEEAKDAAVEALEAERDARLEVIEAQKEQLEEQTSLIDRQIKQKQKEIDAINDAADARQREIDLQKAQYELERMQNQHTILQYSEAEGMHYVQDTSGIRDAREQADEAKWQIEIAGIEKEIDLLENEKDLIQEQIDLLDEQTELINTFYDAEIEKVEKFYDDQIRTIEIRRTATESHFESVIRNLEDSKAKYEELTSVVDKAELSAKLKQLGIDEEALLGGSEEEFKKLKDTYMGIVSQLNEGNDAVMTSLQSLSGFTDTASQTTAIASDVGTIADGLNRIPDSQTITNLSDAFDALAESINKVAAALGLSKEAEIGTLAQAILNLNNIPLDDASKGIIAYFTNLKTAIDSVTSAINGGGGESSDSEGQGGSPGKSGEARGKDSKDGGGGSLADAITSMGETAAEVIGEADAEGDGTVIGEFGSLKTAVDNVTTAVGTGESEDGNNNGGNKTKAGGKSRSKDEDSGGLTGSIVNLGKTTEETLGEPGGDGIIGRFEQFKEPISEAAGHVQSISDGLDAIDGKEVECTITVNVNQTGGADMGGAVLGKMNLDSTSYSAKFGKSNANGTGKNKGLPKAERNALISEYGQTELTVFPNGNTVLTSEPTLMDLPKGTVIFNEDQTKQLMRSKVHVADTSHTDHATASIQPSSSGENRIVPFQPGDLMYDYMQKWNAYFGNTGRQTAMLMPGSMYERSKQLYNTANQITGNNFAGKKQPNVHVGDIHITCPGVTSKEVAKQVGVELNHMFSGLHLDADQQSRMR